LPDPSNIAMTEDTEHPSEELDFVRVSFDVLLLKKLNDGLSHREFSCLHENYSAFSV
jgi:hypothetical protein